MSGFIDVTINLDQGKNMKPFDLVAALNGHPVCIRTGAKVYELVFLRSVNMWAGSVLENGNYVVTWNANGTFFDDQTDSVWDLFMEDAQ